LELAIVDAFVTDRPFSGNPAGVVVLPAFPTDDWMQSLADQLQQAETSFVVPRPDGDFDLRWFTPVAEVALCGHATLAASWWLWAHGGVPADAPVVFHTASGELRCVRGHDEMISMQFPAVPAAPMPLTDDLLSAVRGAPVEWVGVTQQADVGERNVLAVLTDEHAVTSLEPDLQAVERLPAGGLIVTARGGPAQVVSRYFAPRYGIPEDPVTGSAHCTVGPYWAPELGPELNAWQASKRGGALHVTTSDESIVLRGRARAVLRADLDEALVPPPRG
jgi:PhzF family phenazine biosynthesis protein